MRQGMWWGRRKVAPGPLTFAGSSAIVGMGGLPGRCGQQEVQQASTARRGPARVRRLRAPRNAVQAARSELQAKDLELQTTQEQVAALQAQVANLQPLFGRKSEATPPGGDSAPGSGTPAPAPPDEEPPDEEPPDEEPPAGKPPRRKRGRQPGSPTPPRVKHPHLPTVVERLDVPEADRCCQHCGTPYQPCGYKVSWLFEIDWEAVRRKLLRLRYRPACACSAARPVIASPAPRLGTSQLGASVWAWCLVQVYALFRPQAAVARDLGSGAARAAVDAVGGTAAALAPVRAAGGSDRGVPAAAAGGAGGRDLLAGAAPGRERRGQQGPAGRRAAEAEELAVALPGRRHGAHAGAGKPGPGRGPETARDAGRQRVAGSAGVRLLRDVQGLGQAVSGLGPARALLGPHPPPRGAGRHRSRAAEGLVAGVGRAHRRAVPSEPAAAPAVGPAAAAGAAERGVPGAPAPAGSAAEGAVPAGRGGGPGVRRRVGAARRFGRARRRAGPSGCARAGLAVAAAPSRVAEPLRGGPAHPPGTRRSAPCGAR